MILIERKNADTSVLLSSPERKAEERVCYSECSEINPHLAETCDRLGDYYPRCPTYKARLNGRMK